jgi:hypothetical protein
MSSEGATVTPSSLAFWTLMASWNLLGLLHWKIGRLLARERSSTMAISAGRMSSGDGPLIPAAGVF